MGTVTVTGSRLRRLPGSGPSPIVVFDQERIQTLGVSSIADVLNYLPQQPFSFNEATNFGGARMVRLRGLGVGTTLVLINGRRTVTSALQGASNVFDLNAVPLAAVDRIEVLSDSASAVYGADAVGGVVNIILKTDSGPPAVSLYHGSASGGADEQRASLTAGHAGARFRGTALVDIFSRDELPGAARERYANKDFRRFGSTDMRSPIANPGNIMSLTSANLPGLSSQFAAVPIGSPGVGLTAADFAATAGQRNLDSLPRFSSAVPESERLSSGGYAELDLTGAMTAFLEFLYTQRDDVRVNLPASLINRTVPASNAFNPFGVAVRVNYLFAGLGPRPEFSQADSLRWTAGARGGIGSWDWELAVLNTEEDGSNRTLNNVDTNRVNAALASNDPALALNVFQDGPGASRDVLQSLVATPFVANYSSRAFQGSGFFRGPLFSLPAGDALGILGFEARREELGFDSTTVVFADRHTSSAFSELHVPLAGATARAGALALTLAARYDHYNDFGSTFNPQYGLEWSPAANLLLRASYGTSFRAPSLFELYSPVTVNSTALIADPRRNDETTVYTNRSGGNPHLEPEVSDSFSAGFVFSPNRDSGLRIEASYWRIEQQQRVQRLSTAMILGNESFFPRRVARDVPSAGDIAAGLPGRVLSIDVTSLNFGELETSGADARVSMAIETPLGVLSPGVTATRVATYKAADFPDTPAIERMGVANSQGSIPEWRATASLGWTMNGLGLSTTARYVSSYADTNSINVRNGGVVDEQILVDIQGSVDLQRLIGGESFWLRGASLRVGVINLLDKAPEFSAVRGNLGFDYVQGDIRQRFVYATLSKSF